MSLRARLAAWLWVGGPADRAVRRQVAAETRMARLLRELAEAAELVRAAEAARDAARAQTAAAQHAADQLGADLRDRDKRIRTALAVLADDMRCIGCAQARRILAADVGQEGGRG